jgi:hypothetical protein
VAVEDLYKPWKLKRSNVDEKHFVNAGKWSVILFAVALSLMAILSYYWQRYTALPLLSFALGVMAFAYTGLLGVYGAALFTQRGNTGTVPLAFLGGFSTVLFLQPYVFGVEIGFAWQMILGTMVSFGVMLTGKNNG